MILSRFRVATLGIACGFCVASLADAQVLYPSADTNIEEHTPDSDDTTQARIQVRSRNESGSGRQNVGYIQFDLSSIVAPLTESRFEITMQSSAASDAGANQLYGLNDIAGNTAQNWANLTYNTVGDEVPGDGDSETQDLGSIGTTGAENLWDIGDLPAITGVADELLAIDQTSNPQLLSFLNSRIGNFATLLIVQDNGVDNELLFNASEDPAELRPRLVIPEPASVTLLAIGLLAAFVIRRHP